MGNKKSENDIDPLLRRRLLSEQTNVILAESGFSHKIKKPVIFPHKGREILLTICKLNNVCNVAFIHKPYKGIAQKSITKVF